MKGSDWSEEEFGDAQLGDQRLTRRLVQLARQRAAKPNASIAESCGGLAGTRAAYRFYDNPKMSLAQIQAAHSQATVKRMAHQRVVLAVQDTTEVNLTDHPHTAGVGYLHDLSHSGYFLHTTLMVTPQREPLGVIQQQVWVRDPAEFGKKKTRKERPIAEKESQKWLTSLQEVARIQVELPTTQLVSVGDSEADVYALFAEAEQLGQPFLVRAAYDRLVENEDERHLWSHLEQLPIAGTLVVSLPRQESRPPRTARLNSRLARVSLKAPIREKDRLGPVALSVWALLVREEATPAQEADPIEWKLLTNVPTDSFEQAQERVKWYSCRWVVEMFHRVLKSGCRIEARQFDDLDNICRFLAVDSVVAWRVLYVTLCSREAPDLPCEVFLETYEWQALYGFIHKTNQIPAHAPPLAEAVGWIARLGGFTASRKHQPGTTVLWRGFSRLNDIALAWLAFRSAP